MSSAQRVWLLAAVLISTFAGYLVTQSSIQEAETQTGGAGQDAEAPTYTEGNQRDFVSDKLIVKLEDTATSADLEAVNQQNNASTEEDLPRSQVNVVDLPSDLPVSEAISRYEASPDVEYAEPDFILKPSQTTSANDPRYSSLYGLNNTGQNGGAADADVDAPEAWNTTTGDVGTVVAVIDEGMDTNHPDLKNNIWTNPGETGTDAAGRDKATNGVDDDGNTYVDDVNGWDFANNDATVYDPDPISGAGDEHGTHVAGTIAAEGNNSLGVVGVNWKAKVMPLKFLGPDGGSTSDAIEALNYAVAKGVKISNNSWGGGGSSQALLDAIKRADASGHLFVAAAGNGGADGVGDDNDATPSYPSSYNSPNVISVAATDNRDALASFSNYGSSSVDLAAPGVGILSTLPGSRYGSYNGTSMATPHVTGAAALLKSSNPSLDDAQLKARILESAENKTNLQARTATGGRLNAQVSLAQTTAPDPGADTAGPTVASVKPASGSRTRDRTPAIAATVSDDRTELAKGSIQLYVDGAEKTDFFSYDLATDRLTYTSSRLSYARHTVTIVATDEAGNATTKSWSFRVVR